MTVATRAHPTDRPRRTGRRRLPLLLVLGGLLAGAAACGPDADKVVTQPPEPEVAVPEPEPEPEPEPDPEPVDDRPVSPLTGERVDEQLLERPLLLVKIDNAPQAWPHSGLEAADVVFEERVESGITRLLAIFHSELPEVVGPVRSARPVDAQLMSGYGRSIFAFSGARGDVQPLLSAAPSVLVTEGGPGFFRDGARRAPHNLYLDAGATVAGLADRDPDPISEVTIGWVFDDEPPPGALACPDDLEGCTDPGGSIDIRISSGYLTSWEFDADAGRYRRSQNGEPYQVTGPDRVGAANVVVLDTRFYLSGPNCYGAPCPETDVVTDGAPALVLRDGQRYAATFRKPTPTAPLELLDPDGRRFPLAPGPTWVHLPDGLPGLAD